VGEQINCQLCVTITLCSGFNVIENFTLSLHFPLARFPLARFPFPAFRRPFSVSHFPFPCTFRASFNPCSLQSALPSIHPQAAFVLICRFSNCRGRLCLFKSFSTRSPKNGRAKAEKARKNREKQGALRKRKIIILQFLIKWQWQLLLRCSGSSAASSALGNLS